jgi:hypothetical protein
MAYSKAKLKSSGDKASPCFRPFWFGFNVITEFFLLKIWKAKQLVRTSKKTYQLLSNNIAEQVNQCGHRRITEFYRKSLGLLKEWNILQAYMKRVLIGKYCSFYYIIREETLCKTVVKTNHSTSTILKSANFTQAKVCTTYEYASYSSYKLWKLNIFRHHKTKKLNSMAWVRMRTIPTDWATAACWRS